MLVVDLGSHYVVAGQTNGTISGFICNVTGDYNLIDQEGNSVKTHLVAGTQYNVPYLVDIRTSAGVRVAIEQITIWF